MTIGEFEQHLRDAYQSGYRTAMQKPEADGKLRDSTWASDDLANESAYVRAVVFSVVATRAI
jgi:hypothetical protein